MTDDEKALKRMVKQDILVDGLELDDVTADEIVDDEPLFDGRLALDSLEAFQIITLLEEKFGVTFEGMAVLEIQSSLYSVNRICEFIISRLNHPSSVFSGEAE